MMMLVVNSFLFRTTIGYHPPTIHKTYGMDWMHFLFLPSGSSNAIKFRLPALKSILVEMN